MDTKQHTMICEDGREFPIGSISLVDLNESQSGIEKIYRDCGELIDPPLYEFDAGEVLGKVTKALDETMIEVKGNPEETAKRREIWDKHLEARGRMMAEQGRASQYIIMDGLKVSLPSDDTWIKRRAKRGLVIPETTMQDPDELLLYYKMHEILKTPGDVLRAQQEILILSASGAVKREAVEAAGDSFLRKLSDIGAGKANTDK